MWILGLDRTAAVASRRAADFFDARARRSTGREPSTARSRARDATRQRDRARRTMSIDARVDDTARRRAAMDSTAASDAERAFKAKYGDALRPKPRLIATDVKHFDSADWAMRKSAEEARARDAGTRATGRGWRGIDDVGDDGG